MLIKKIIKDSITEKITDNTKKTNINKWWEIHMENMKKDQIWKQIGPEVRLSACKTKTLKRLGAWRPRAGLTPHQPTNIPKPLPTKRRAKLAPLGRNSKTTHPGQHEQNPIPTKRIKASEPRCRQITLHPNNTGDS